MPSLRQLRYLVAIADHLHFRRAAEACHVTQPTLSAQLKELETRLGAVLVERNRARVVLTPSGRAIADRARKVLSEVEEIRTIAKTGQAMLESTIRVGVVQSTGSYFLPLIVPELHRDYPRLGFYIREGLPAPLLRELEEGGLDLLFFPVPVRRQDFESLSLFRESLLVVAPYDHPLAAEPTVDPNALRGETILSLEAAHNLSDQLREICEDFGAKLSHDYEATSLDTLRQMVAMGMGLSLMPALYVRSEVEPQDIVVARPFRSIQPSRTIGMIWRRGSARQEEFLFLARLICQILKKKLPEMTVLG